MVKYTSDFLEFRGFKKVTSEKGNVYGLLFAEDEFGESFKFYCRDIDVLNKLECLNKGVKIKLIVNYNKYKDLVISDVLFDSSDISLGSRYLDMEL